jgi:hypothetical protein
VCIRNVRSCQHRSIETVGLSENQTQSAIEGKVPEGLSEREEAAFVFAGELVRVREPLGEGRFGEAVGELGMEAVGELLHRGGGLFV